MRGKGATQEDIAGQLTTVDYTEGMYAQDDAQCIICLTGYDFLYSLSVYSSASWERLPFLKPFYFGTWIHYHWYSI